MSIAAMADVRLMRTEAANSTAPADAPKTKAGIPAGVLNTLTAWIPTETVTGYVAVQAAMDKIVVKKGEKLCNADFGDRWQLFGVMLVLTIALVPIYTRIKSANSTTPFKPPVIEMAISGVAFVLWALALQDSPFNDFCGIKSWHSVLALVVGGAVLAGVTTMLKESPPWSDAANNNAPPSPVVK